jgi:hypothetical protein
MGTNPSAVNASRLSAVRLSQLQGVTPDDMGDAIEYTHGLNAPSVQAHASDAAARSSAGSVYTKDVITAASLNESKSAQKYISDMLTAEVGRVSGLETVAKTERYKLRSQLMMYEYLDGYYRSATTVLVALTYITLLMLVCAALWRAHAMPSGWFWAAMLLLFVAYLLTAVFAVNTVAHRRGDSWHHKRWGAAGIRDKIGKGASCAGGGTQSSS